MTAVHLDDRAGDEIAFRQQERCVRDFVGFADAIEQVQPGQAVGIFDAVPGVQGCADNARRDGVDADIVLSEFRGELAGQGVDGALAGDGSSGRTPAMA